MKLKIICFCLILFSINIPVQAHQTVQNNGIEITMHIEPNDAPTTTQTASFKTYFSDSNNKFQGSNCDCFSEIKSERGVNKFPMKILSKASYDYANFAVNFQKPGQYTIIFTGKPKQGLEENKNFRAFEIPFNFRVETESGQTIKDSIWLYYLAYILIILVLFYLLWIGIQLFQK